MTSTPRPTDPQDRTYRTVPARVTGWGLVVAAVAMTLLLVRSEQEAGGTGYLVPAAVLVSALTLVWVALLRPCVLLGPEGVALRNLVTDVDVPFSRLAGVDDNWALELVDTAGRTHSSWAVPTRRDFRRRNLADDFSEATTKAQSRQGVHAKAVAGDVEHRWQRWRLEGGAQETGMAADRRPAPGALVPLAVAVVLWALAVLL